MRGRTKVSILNIVFYRGTKGEHVGYFLKYLLNTFFFFLNDFLNYYMPHENCPAFKQFAGSFKSSELTMEIKFNGKPVNKQNQVFFLLI